MKTTKWTRCYEDSWQGLITDEAFAHPAKMARGLLRRIIKHLALPLGSVVVDPFGGVGTTGIEAASNGLFCYSCELEPKFHRLAEINYALHSRTWLSCGDPLPVIVCGDSRRLRANLAAVMGDAVVGSPPFCEQQSGGGLAKSRTMTDGSSIGKTDGYVDQGTTPGQLGAMKPGDVDAVVSSPPYEGSQGTPSLGSVNKDDWGKDGTSITTRRGLTAKYGDADGQLGHTTGDTFWSAASDIIAECYAILKPGGVAAWVCKDFVRKGERVPFSDDWRRLCESHGFVTTEWVQAMLVEKESHPSLFGGEPIVTKTERKSFFRRLAEKKGSPPIDHEDVLIMVKPSGGGGGADAVVGSPPFCEQQSGGGICKTGTPHGGGHSGTGGYRDQGSTPGQLGNMKPGTPPEH